MKAKSIIFVCGLCLLLLSGCAASLGPGYGYGAGYYPPRPYYGYGPRTEVIVGPAYRHGGYWGHHGGYGGRGRHWR